MKCLEVINIATVSIGRRAMIRRLKAEQYHSEIASIPDRSQ